MILIRALGPVEITLDGMPAPPELVWRKHLALLVYLARSPRRGRSREHLMGLLWADKPEAAARHSLNEAVRLFRHWLGDHAVDTGGGQVRLSGDTIQLDVEQLEALAGTGDFRGASAMIAGEFLEGFAVPGASGFEDWLTAEQTAWRKRSLEILAQYSGLLLRAGKASDAASVALRAIALDPRSAHAVRAALRAFALAGDRATALQCYEGYANRLADELGTIPDAETAALAERVRRERLGRPVAPARAGEPAGARMRLPLVGREAELENLLDVTTACLAGRGAAALLIEGDSGAGKTRLLEELLARLRLDGATVTAVRAVEADLAEPWIGVVALSRGGLLSAPGLAGAPPAALATFAAHAEEWAEQFPGTVTASPPTLGRALSDVVRAAAEERAVVLAVDDAQWLDHESLLALVALLRDLPSAPVAVVLTIPRHPAREAIDQLRSRIGRDLPGIALTVGALSAAPLRTLAQHLLPTYAEVEIDRVVRRVATDSASVPLLAVELLRAVALGLDLRGTGGAWPAPLKTLDDTWPGDLPDAVVAAIRVGYRRLTSDARRVLAAASVLGDRVAPSTLAAGSGLASESVLRALDELEWHRWLVCEPRGYGFVARIVRKVIARDMLTPGQRQRVLDAVATTRS
jgi:DNA-binding SARP family transcriptional activator